MRKEAIEDEMKKEASNLKKEAFEDVFEETRCGRYQRFLWDLMEKPHTSLAAKVRQISLACKIDQEYFFQSFRLCQCHFDVFL